MERIPAESKKRRRWGAAPEAKMDRTKFGRARTVLAAACALNIVWASACSGAERPTQRDALERKVRRQLSGFVKWLERNDAKGYVGEAGWPDNSKGDASEWNSLARGWFDIAISNDLWVSTWATGEWWDDYDLSVYEATREETGVDKTNSQAPVLESAARRSGRRVGINVNGGEFGSPITPREARFSNERPGSYNTGYHYDSQATFDYLAERGMGHVRIPFRWERIQPEISGPLDKKELTRLRAAVGRAAKAGLPAILDVHNYGAYYLDQGDVGVRKAIGSNAVSLADFADLWRRLSAAFKNDRRVAMYALMAEPNSIPPKGAKKPAEVWENASQKALKAIRSNHDDKLVAVPGYGWDALQVFERNHPDSWIQDPSRNFVYEVHHYWDRDHSGDYSNSYSAEVEAAERAGW
jgi:Cellulase (glycosyl hydrolase family 5)